MQFARVFSCSAIEPDLTPGEAENDYLGVTGLPSVKIDEKSPNFFLPHIPPGIHKPKKLLGFGGGEEWRVQKFRHPIHLVRIRQVKCDLNILIRIFDDDQAIIVDVLTLEFAFEEYRTSFLHLNGTQLGLFKV